MNREFVKKPWGEYDRFTLNEQTTIKILTVLPGEMLSLQYHENREEFWRVLDGTIEVTRGGEKLSGNPGDEYTIEKKMEHRIANNGSVTARVLEISFGEFDEGDIVRTEDKYNRN
jgi:mannose-6-phosphate isomerase